MTSLLFVGFLLGMRHALDADHIATVASLASVHPNRWQVIKQGLAWGLGHSLMLLAVGAVVLWSDSLIPQQITYALQMAVGALMILLGADVLRRARQDKIHFHAHQHRDGTQHFHAHSHRDQPQNFTLAPFIQPQLGLQHKHGHHNHSHSRKKDWPLRALFVGVIHGLAGSAALVLLFVDQVNNMATGLMYILTFGLGSILGMGLFSLAISVPLGFTAKKLTGIHTGMQLTIGVVTTGLGVMIMAATFQLP
jgi:ABC-type nickel/cobalt efflux system permease component RcnA